MALRGARDSDIEEYRALMERPSEFEDGVTLRTAIGALFIGVVMMPGSIYMGLIAGAGMGPAAEWVTIILFAEIARRSLTRLSRQEVYILYYIAGGLTTIIGGVMLAGGPFGMLIWNQYLVQSTAAKGFGIADKIPQWVSPPEGSEALIKRTFLHRAWLPAISLMVLSQILSRISWFSMAYTLFRVTSDLENLPFPLAPVAAQGATALAETTEDKETWRWRVFSVGMAIGLGFGAIYVGLPALSGLITAKPIVLLPIPWIDFTRTTQSILPAAPIGIVTNLSAVLMGFILPFWVVVGGFMAAMIYVFANPIFYRMGLLPSWRPGMDTIMTSFSNSVDLWLSLTIGTAFAVAAVGIFHALRSAGRRGGRRTTSYRPPPGRGDFPISLAVLLYTASTVAYIILCMKLLKDDRFPWIFLVAFGFLITPLISYVNARMVGLTGQLVGFPYVREGAFILSGYKGVDIWFAPIPYADYGRRAMLFREVELTGTKFTSIIKAELMILPISLICGFIFWSLIWKMSPIPSPTFQYAQNFWHLIALRNCLWYSATTEGGSVFAKAIKLKWIITGFGFGLSSFLILSALALPTSLVYGFIRGMGTLPHMIIPEMAGALIAKYYFERKFGRKTWRLYAVVLMAGYACGMGLIGMGSVAIALITKSVLQLPY